MSKLLVPTDFSDSSLPTMNYGIELANALGIGVLLFYYLDISLYNANYYNIDLGGVTSNISEFKEVFDNAEKKYKKFKKYITGKYGEDFSVELKTGSGWFADLVIEMAQLKEVDMILLSGKKDYSFFNRFISNNNTIIIDQASCPVWIIPEGYAFKSFKQMVYTTDYTKADLSMLERLVQLASKFKATITALHIMDDKSFHEQLKQKGFENMVREHCKYNKIIFFSMEGEGTIEKVDDFADRVNADLLVMLQENRGFLERLFSKSTTQRLFFKTDLPVLIFHEKSMDQK